MLYMTFICVVVVEHGIEHLILAIFSRGTADNSICIDNDKWIWIEYSPSPSHYVSVDNNFVFMSMSVNQRRKRVDGLLFLSMCAEKHLLNNSNSSIKWYWRWKKWNPTQRKEISIIFYFKNVFFYRHVDAQKGVNYVIKSETLNKILLQVLLSHHNGC